MKKFSHSNLNYNPFSLDTFKGRLYKMIENNVSSTSGKVVGIKELVEKISSMSISEIKELQIDLLEKTKLGLLECDEVEPEGEDFSAKINSMIDNNEDLIDDEKDNFTQTHNIEPEPLTEKQVQNFLKKLNS